MNKVFSWSREDVSLVFVEFKLSVPLGEAVQNVRDKVGTFKAYVREFPGIQPRNGTIESVDNKLDPQSGTIRVRAVFDNADGTRTFTAAWYTFDDSGLPFWLFAQGVIDIGDRTTGNVDTYYATGGCFAGVGCGSASFTKWGTINFSFPDCSHMNFTYNGDGSAVNGPKGSSQRSWLRIANVNSIVCN